MMLGDFDLLISTKTLINDIEWSLNLIYLGKSLKSVARSPFWVVCHTKEILSQAGGEWKRDILE